MSTGAPIYLVSACSSGEEFVAAFRRYADRTGLFVPIADPIPVGRKGRFALTLADGSVMVEGEAEIVSSSRTPSVLHGRVGMTVRFSDPDPHSKTVLVELEKARLVPKPTAPSVPPRLAEVPPAPRPTPPVPGGRVDASNALAECVAIGNLDGLAVVATQAAKPGAARFVVPTIPPVAGARPKAPTTPPFLSGKSGDSGPTRKPPSDTGGFSKQTDSSTFRKPPSDTGGFSKQTDSSAFRKPPSDTGGFSKQTDSGGFAKQTDSGAFRKPAPDSELGSLLKTSDAIPRPVDAPRPDSGGIRRPTDPGLFSSLAPDSGPLRKSTAPTTSSADSSRLRKPVTKTQAVAIVPPPVPVPPRGSITRPPPIAPQTNTPTEPQMSLRPELPTPTSTTSPRAPISDTVTVPPIDTSLQSEGRGGPLSTTQHAVAPLERGYSETMDITLGDITGASSPLDLDDVIPPPPPLNVNDISGITAIAPPPKAQELEPVPQAKVQTPEDLLTTIRTPRPQMDLLSTMRSSAPPMPPILGTPPPALPEVEIGEPTDLTVIPTGEDAQDLGTRRTEMGIAVVPASTTVLPAVTPSPDDEPAASDAARAARMMPTPHVEEATPSGDWTMIPGSQGPTIAPREPEPKRQDRLTGDWSIQLDSDAPDGWSPPSKVEKIAPAPEKPAATKPRSSSKAERPEPAPPPAAPAGPVEPKVQIDPTLIEPLQAMPPDPTPMFATLTPVPHIMPSQSAQYPMAPVALQTSPHPAYAVPHAPDTGASFFHEHVPRPQDSTSVTDIGRRRRYIVIGISAAIVVAVGIALLVMLGVGGDDAPPTVTPTDQGSAPAIAPDAGGVTAVMPDAAVVVPPKPDPVAAKCFVHIKSVPTGGEVVRDTDRDKILGTTPAKLELPCGSEVMLFIRKKGYVGEKRAVTPATGDAELQLELQRNILVVKVSSSPPGATIMMGKKSLGVTPATIKLPAFEASTITIAKDGYDVESRKVVPKANNTTVHAALSKKRR